MTPELDEPVQLCSYDEQRPEWFASEAVRIAGFLPADARIEHIGSTSVPGLFGKPVIDIMAGLRRLGEADPLAARDMETSGKQGLPDGDTACAARSRSMVTP